VERACRNRTALQAGAKQSFRPASDLGADVTWQKSSYSTYNGNCVEVAVFDSSEVGVRDSKDRLSGPVLLFSATDWEEFLNVVRSGEPRLP
jgi:hypothetical protein